MKVYLREKEVADHYSLGLAWLRAKRLRGDGPPITKVGRSVLYKREDLERWLNVRAKPTGNEQVH